MYCYDDLVKSSSKTEVNGRADAKAAEQLGPLMHHRTNTLWCPFLLALFTKGHLPYSRQRLSHILIFLIQIHREKNDDPAAMDELPGVIIALVIIYFVARYFRGGKWLLL